MAYISTSSLECLDAEHGFRTFDVELPAAASHWIQRLQELRAHRPEPAPRNAVAELLAADADEADISAAIAQHVGQQHRITQHSEAEHIAGARALAAVMEHRDELHRALAKLADELITRLHAAALIEEDIRELTRQRRVDEAHMLATADADCAELLALYQLRNKFLTPVGSHWSTGWWSCEHFSNPWQITRRHGEYDETLWGLRRAERLRSTRLRKQ